jgi:hypothetical protein
MSAPPLTLGLLEKRIDGDDCLLELAKRRFAQDRLGAEVHGGGIEPLEYLLRFRPAPDLPVVIHLPRDFKVQDEGTRQRITELAARFAGRVHGMVIHDHPDLASQPRPYLQAVEDQNRRLERVPNAPLLFIEYAVGLPLAVFAEFFIGIRRLALISTCLDSGHVGIYVARQTYAKGHSGEDVCALKSLPPHLPAVMPDVEAAKTAALPALLDLIRSVGALGKPIHFHLHDGHPLSRVSPFGVSDHLGFDAEIPLPFGYRGRRNAPPLYGPAGLSKIIATALQAAQPQAVSFTLEIHPTFERAPLGAEAPLFHHWTDKTNAEKMNHWVGVLLRNHTLLRTGAIGA